MGDPGRRRLRRIKKLYGVKCGYQPEEAVIETKKNTVPSEVPSDLFFDFRKDKYPMNDVDFTKFVNTRISDAYRRGQEAGK